MAFVRIVSEGGKCSGTKIIDQDGNEIHGVTAIFIKPMRPGNVLEAVISVRANLDIEANAILCLDSLREAADAHGYDLTKRG